MAENIAEARTGAVSKTLHGLGCCHFGHDYTLSMWLEMPPQERVARTFLKLDVGVLPISRTCHDVAGRAANALEAGRYGLYPSQT